MVKIDGDRIYLQEREKENTKLYEFAEESIEYLADDYHQLSHEYNIFTENSINYFNIFLKSDEQGTSSLGEVVISDKNPWHHSAVILFNIPEGVLKKMNDVILYDIVFSMAKWAMTDIGFERISVKTIETAKKLIDVLKRVGFQEDGRERRALYTSDGRKDNIIFGLLKSEPLYDIETKYEQWWHKLTASYKHNLAFLRQRKSCRYKLEGIITALLLTVGMTFLWVIHYVWYGFIYGLFILLRKQVKREEEDAPLNWRIIVAIVLISLILGLILYVIWPFVSRLLSN